MGLGSGAADLPFDHPCLKSNPHPARLTIALTYYGGEMAQMLEMQGPMVDEQTLEGRFPLDQAKSAVAEVFGKLAKTDFSKAK